MSGLISPRHPTLLHALLANAERGDDAPSTYVLNEAEEAARIRHDVLAQAALRVSQHLTDAGVGRGHRVVICLPTSPTFLTILFGVLARGAIPSALPIVGNFAGIEQYVESVTSLVTYLEPAAIVAGSDLVDPIRDLTAANIAVLNGDELHATAMASGGAPPVPRLPTPDELGLIQCTSGSTGDPKGVMLTHGNVAANCEQIAQVCEIRSTDTMVHWLPLNHDMGLIGGTLFPVFTGTEAVLLPPTLFLRRPAAWLRAVSHFRGTITASPNFAFGYVTARVSDEELADTDLSTWRFLFCGAEPIHPPTLRRFVDRFAAWRLSPDAVVPCYGLAEATLAVTVARPSVPLAVDTADREALAVEGKVVNVSSDDPRALEVVDCGEPVPATEVRVVDAAGTPLGPDLLGRVQFRGPSASPGYFRSPQATAAVADDDGWIDTGDLGYLRDGRLRVAGRQKDVIIIRGANYFPSDFERVTESVDGVRTGGVAAVGRFDSQTGTESLHLIVETTWPEADHDQLQRRIVAAVTSRIGVAPARVHLVPKRAIPKTSSGKVQRSAAARLLVDQVVGSR